MQFLNKGNIGLVFNVVKKMKKDTKMMAVLKIFGQKVFIKF